MFTASRIPNQIRSIPSASCDGPEERHDDEREFEEIEEEGQQEDQDVDHDQETDLAARQPGKQMLDPAVSIDAVESQREKTRAPTRMKITKVVSLAVVLHRLLEQCSETAA
jgi:hypothetical protein